MTVGQVVYCDLQKHSLFIVWLTTVVISDKRVLGGKSIIKSILAVLIPISGSVYESSHKLQTILHDLEQ